MSAIDQAADRAGEHDGYNPETDDVMMARLGGGVMLEGPSGEYVTCERPVAVREWV